MAAEALGLAFGAVSLAGLFTTCVQCFEMVECGANYARDLEVIYTGFEAQRVRLIIWGQTMAFEKSPDPFHDRPIIEMAARRGLNCIKMLFEDGETLMSKYGLQASTGLAVSQAPVFRETFRRFKERMLASQAHAPLMQTTKWAIRSKIKFRDLVTDLRILIDDLESITRSSEILQRQRVIVDYEIASVSDESSLQLIEDATSASAALLSEAASIRLSQIRGGTDSADNDQASVSTNFWSSHTHATAPDGSEDSDATILTELLQQSHFVITTQNERLGRSLQTQHSPNLIDMQPQPTIVTTDVRRQPVVYRYDDISETVENFIKACDGAIRQKMALRHVQDLMKQSMEPGWRLGLSRIDIAAQALVCFFDGPHDSPYEGGIFYLRMHMPPDYPFKPPVCQLLTRIYHPNFDARGRVCTDILEYGKGWSPALRFTRSILISIASLLSDPNTTDPLVPEIAAQYVQNRATYERIARDYTLRYATSETPDIPISYGNRPWWEEVKISL